MEITESLQELMFRCLMNEATDGEQVQLGASREMKEAGAVIREDSLLLRYERQTGEETGEAVYNELVVPRGCEYRLELADGSRVIVNAGSRLKYPVVFKGAERKVWLQGEAYFEVSKQAGLPFIVATDRLDVRVLGTEFNVMAYEGERNNEVTLVEGKVQVETEHGEQTLQPSRQFVLDCETGESDVRRVDVYLYTAWTDGVLAFDGMPLEDLTARISRWYDVDFVFAQEHLREVKFSGKFKKYNDIDYVLSLLRQVTNIKFDLKNNTVTIYDN